MEKEITILLKMLNGTLKKAPAFLHQTIVQYQWQQAIEGLLYLAGAIVIGMLAYKSIRFLAKRSSAEGYDNLDDSFFFLFFFPIIILFMIAISAATLKLGVDHVGNAISPVTSLIQTLHAI